MIRFILVQNRQGKTRLEKWYTYYEPSAKTKLKQEIHRLVSTRDSKNQANFAEFLQFQLVYRRYAGLFFIFGVDSVDNELGYLEGIHLFVETLDEYFGNVCELDLVFNFLNVFI